MRKLARKFEAGQTERASMARICIQDGRDDVRSGSLGLCFQYNLYDYDGCDEALVSKLSTVQTKIAMYRIKIACYC